MPGELLLAALVLNHLVACKTIRYYAMRYYRGVTVSDIRDAALIGAFVLALTGLLPRAGPALVLGLLAAFTLVLLIDAVLFNRYSFTINPRSVRIFAGNSSAFLDEGGRFFGYIRQRRFFLFPLFQVPVYAVPLGLAGSGWPAQALLAAYLAYAVLLYTKSRFSLPAVAGGALLGAGLFALGDVVPLRAAAIGADTWQWVLGLALASTAATLVLPWLRTRSQLPWAQLHSTVLPLFGHQPVRVRPIDPPHPWHGRIVAADPCDPPATPLFASLRGANVILLTVESFSRYQARALSGTGATLPFFESWLSKSSRGLRHFAISPNTYQTLYTLYNGHYPHVPGMRPVGELNRAGYQSVFLTPHRLALFDTDKLIGACAFDKVYCAETFAKGLRSGTVQAWGASDRAVYEQALARLDAERTDQPLFLAVINSQTHLPYHVYDAKRFSRHTGGGILARYLNALEEADDCLAYLFAALGKRGLLDNTLVIVTGDHGEAFGESNYKGHSNAITREQLEVPLLVHHPALERREFAFSTHFDLFPTVFDLLGIATDIPLAGRSLFAPGEHPGFIAYSRTYQGDLPTCFGFVHPGGKLFVDMIYNRFWETDLEDQVQRVYSGRERQALLWALHEGLRARNLLREPKLA